MGWWKIDARTGQPLGSGSQLSTPEVTLLNAVPGVDAGTDVSYLGDVSGDFALEMARQLSGIVKGQTLTAAEIRELFLLAIAPATWSDALAGEVFQAVDLFWRDVDSAYDDDWSRPANAAEKHWTTEYVVMHWERLSQSAVAKEKPKAAAKVPPIKFPIGSRVWAWWNAPQDDYYIGTVLEPGWILRDADGKLQEEVFYIVQFDDGDEMDVPPERLFALALPAGLQVEFRSASENRYLPASVAGASADSVTVRTSDGRDVSVPLSALRIEGRLLPK
ncbi:hypothetical protein [Anatilimnocola floriformis]|uniref:hypothetical protein n=1 Tax=Anatilimnocola floriformis TaxID=2948575 RepID=UPI0020C3651C|nr:hypothetical protein [Anatilimnocola floriformis]